MDEAVMQLNTKHISDFQRQGVIYVPDVIDRPWVDRMLAVIDTQMENPGKWANDSRVDTDRGRMFTDRYQWRQNAEIYDFIHRTSLAGLAAQAMQSDTVRFYFDHLLVKEPGTQTCTPWHQDLPYWPFMGKQICSIWVALTKTSIAESAMEFVAGSHLDGNYYRPEPFGKGKGNANAGWQQQGQGKTVPDIEANREKYPIVGWDVNPGDALIFSAWTLHWAPGNSSLSSRRAAISTRWLGDDAVWFPHPGADPTIQEEDIHIEPGQPPADEQVFPRLWPPGER